MILLGNFKVSENRLVGTYRRGNLSVTEKRINIAKFTLATYVPLIPLLSKIILYIELDNDCKDQQDEFETFIRNLFPEDKLILHWNRITKIKEWQEMYEQELLPIDDNLIFNLGNDDHFFIGNNLDALESGINHLQNNPDPYIHLSYSHHAEIIRESVLSGHSFTDDRTYLQGNRREFMASDILKKERWRHYWFDFNFDDSPNFMTGHNPYASNVSQGHKYFRTDVLVESPIFPNGTSHLVPLKEICRHYDGYNNTADWSNLLPPIEIPTGFLEKDIKIAYGYETSRAGWININPARPDFKAAIDGGVDYKFALEDIPMAWQGRISTLDINPDADLESLREARDEHYYKTLCFPITGPHVREISPLPRDLLKSHFISQKWINYNV
jgi:hypothetical protein